MKHFKHFALTVLLVLVGNLSASAADFKVDGIYYDVISLTDMTCRVTNCGARNEWGNFVDLYIGDVKIPSSVTYSGRTFSVTEIGQSAFGECHDLTSVEIPNTVTTIGVGAFSRCSNLTSVEIPNTVTTIGNYTFDGCSSLTSVEIPNTITKIGGSMFYKCSSLTSIEIPNSVTSIGDEAFSNCSSLTSVEIPNSVTEIRERAFLGCSSLTSVEIPNSVTEIGEWAFVGCSSLTSVVIPNSVTTIESSTFGSCTSLTSVVIGSSIETIGWQVFWNCTKLKEIILLSTTPPTVEHSNAFEGVSKAECVLKVPAGSVSAYENADVWNTFWNIEAYEASDEPETKDFAIVDGEKYTEKKPHENVNITYTRTFDNTNWQALYVPFSMDYAEWCDWADVAEIYDVHTLDVNKNGMVDADDETVIEFRKVTGGSLRANTPYVIRAKETGEIKKTFEDRTLYAASNGSVNCSSVHWLYTLTGVYEEYTDMVGKYALNSDGEFTCGTSASQKLNPQRFYLRITARDGGYGNATQMQAPKKVRISVDGQTTGIEVVQSPEFKVQSPVYNLQGQRVGADYKGIVIINGKKTLKR